MKVALLFLAISVPLTIWWKTYSSLPEQVRWQEPAFVSLLLMAAFLLLPAPKGTK